MFHFKIAEDINQTGMKGIYTNDNTIDNCKFKGRSKKIKNI